MSSQDTLPRAVSAHVSAARLDGPGGDNRPPLPPHESTDTAAASPPHEVILTMAPKLTMAHGAAATHRDAPGEEQAALGCVGWRPEKRTAAAVAAAFSPPPQHASPRAVSSPVLPAAAAAAAQQAQQAQTATKRRRRLGAEADSGARDSAINVGVVSPQERAGREAATEAGGGGAKGEAKGEAKREAKREGKRP